MTEAERALLLAVARRLAEDERLAQLSVGGPLQTSPIAELLAKLEAEQS